MKNYLILLLLLGFQYSAFSQNTAEKADDCGRITLFAYIPDQVGGLTIEAKKVLENKLNQITTKYGIGGRAIEQRFIITANIIELTKDISSTTPAIYTYNLQITFYIGDGKEGTKFSSYAINIKGSGKSEAKAYLAALANMKTDDPAYGKFLEEGKTRIVEYYNSKCDFILKEAKMLESRSEFDAAIAKLVGIPEVCKDCYSKAMDAVGLIYQKQIDKECKILMSKAKSIWSANQDENGATEAANALAQIDPNSSCYNDAKGMMEKIYQDIKTRVKEIEDREWKFKLKQQQDNVDMQKANIKAARDIGVAYGTHQQPTVYNIRTWW
jgi:hypothetical protein